MNLKVRYLGEIGNYLEEGGGKANAMRVWKQASTKH